jgi:hypothetical protein
MEILGLEMKKEDTSSLRTADVGALTTLGTFACTNWWKMRVMNWTNQHLRRVLLRMSGLKEGAARAVGE